MEMWCPDDIGRDSWDWVGPPAWRRACFNSPEWGGGSSSVKTEPPQIVLLLLLFLNGHVVPKESLLSDGLTLAIFFVDFRLKNVCFCFTSNGNSHFSSEKRLPQNGLLIFLWKETHSETKSRKFARILTKKNYNNNGKSWKSSRISRVNPILFIFSFYHFFYNFFIFSFFSFIPLFSLKLSFVFVFRVCLSHLSFIFVFRICLSYLSFTFIFRVCLSSFAFVFRIYLSHLSFVSCLSFVLVFRICLLYLSFVFVFRIRLFFFFFSDVHTKSPHDLAPLRNCTTTRAELPSTPH